jgi:hypothetical protein
MNEIPSNIPDLAAKKANKGCFGCLGIIAVLFIIGLIAQIGGCDKTTDPQKGEHALTKAQWRQKALPYYNPGGGGRKVTTVADFKGVMGEPARTETLGGYVYWFYDCSDGTIQVKLIDPAMSGGTLAIETINDD